MFLFDECLHLVFEFVHTDLEKLIRDKSLFFRESHVKSLMHMLTAGVKACHDNFVLHRVSTFAFPAKTMIGFWTTQNIQPD